MGRGEPYFCMVQSAPLLIPPLCSFADYLTTPRGVMNADVRGDGCLEVIRESRAIYQNDSRAECDHSVIVLNGGAVIPLQELRVEVFEEQQKGQCVPQQGLGVLEPMTLVA